MKALLLFPPQWIPVSPHLGLPVLAGQLGADGHEATVHDLNIEFYNYVLSEENLAKAHHDATDFMKSHTPSELDYNENSVISLREKAFRQKMKTIRDFYALHPSPEQTIVAEIAAAMGVLRSPVDFYCPEKLFSAKHIVSAALELASLPFAPSKLLMDNFRLDPNIPYDWESLHEFVADEKRNMFFGFLNAYADGFAPAGYDCIGISVGDLSQLSAALTLARLLKTKCRTRLFFGGNYLTQIFEDLGNFPALFEQYCDCVLLGDSEKSVREYASYIENQRDLSEVSGILYKDENGTIKSTFHGVSSDCIDRSAFPDFGDYSFSRYFSPKPVFPIQLSKGCYWGKCSFCDYFYGHKEWSSRCVEDAVDCLEHYINNYRASCFYIIDEALPPEYYNALALEILRRQLRISFYSFARLESGFTDDVLQNIFRAGGKMLMWGYEAASPRVFTLMNKGIDPAQRLYTLSVSANAGIWNNGLLMIGFPTETEEEIAQTRDAVIANPHLFHSCTPANFNLLKNAAMMKDLDRLGITVTDNEPALMKKRTDVGKGLSVRERLELRQKIDDDLNHARRGHLWVTVYSDFDHLLLYLDNYGFEWVYNYQLDDQA